MRVAGYNKEVAHDRLGPTLVIAASMILAVRTAKWNGSINPSLSNREWEAEVERALRMAQMVISHATSRWPQFFSRRDVPWYEPDDTDQPK